MPDAHHRNTLAVIILIASQAAQNEVFLALRGDGQTDDPLGISHRLQYAEFPQLHNGDKAATAKYSSQYI